MLSCPVLDDWVKRLPQRQDDGMKLAIGEWTGGSRGDFSGRCAPPRVKIVETSIGGLPAQLELAPLSINLYEFTVKQPNGIGSGHGLP